MKILLHLFTPMSTHRLLSLTVISHRIYNVILRILHNRLVEAAELHSHTLLLECYHPSAKLTEPAYFCTYLGTDGLSLYESSTLSEHNSGRLGEMDNLYCRFRPHRRELEPGGRRVLPRPGDIPGSRTYPGTVQDRYEGSTVKQLLSLEEHELFTQLVAQINLVKIGPRNLFTCFVGVEEGVLRLFREWLRAIDERGRTAIADEEPEIVQNAGKGKKAVEDKKEHSANLDDPRILWVTPAKNTGIRFNIKERKLRRDAPILIRADEDSPVSYEVEFDGRHISMFFPKYY